MARNNTRATINAKAKKAAIDETLQNQYAFLSTSFNTFKPTLDNTRKRHSNYAILVAKHAIMSK